MGSQRAGLQLSDYASLSLSLPADYGCRRRPFVALLPQGCRKEHRVRRPLVCFLLLTALFLWTSHFNFQFVCSHIKWWKWWELNDKVCIKGLAQRLEHSITIINVNWCNFLYYSTFLLVCGMWTMKKRKRLHLKTGIAICMWYIIELYDSREILGSNRI